MEGFGALTGKHQLELCVGFENRALSDKNTDHENKNLTLFAIKSFCSRVIGLGFHGSFHLLSCIFSANLHPRGDSPAGWAGGYHQQPDNINQSQHALHGHIGGTDAGGHAA